MKDQGASGKCHSATYAPAILLSHTADEREPQPGDGKNNPTIMEKPVNIQSAVFCDCRRFPGYASNNALFNGSDLLSNHRFQGWRW